jgi:hypothetical protein
MQLLTSEVAGTRPPRKSPRKRQPLPTGGPLLVGSLAGPFPEATFRWLAWRYSRVVRDRVDVGEQLRAVFQGRSKQWTQPPDLSGTPDQLLKGVRLGVIREPSPVADIYRALADDEERLRDALSTLVELHPAWSWLQGVRGIGPVLASQLLARLDRSRAPRPSSFWFYCGLATIPATLAVCEVCGAEYEVSTDRRTPREHIDRRERGARCSGKVRRVEGQEIRVAQSRGVARSQLLYDHAARRLCHIIGIVMLRQSGTFEPVYREGRARLSVERPDWTKGRVHLASMRLMEKAFLRELWNHWPAPNNT